MPLDKYRTKKVDANVSELGGQYSWRYKERKFCNTKEKG